MAKEKQGKHVHEHPIKMGDNFICPKCKAVVPMKKDCPECRVELDWNKI